jgi:inward rectifier potassium channel
LILHRFRQYVFGPPAARVIRLGERRLIAEGLERNIWSDQHHYAMTASWPAFFATLALIFTLLNLFFASLYWLCSYFGDAPIANARPGAFLDYFFFSVETLATVGYGDMHPRSLCGHFIATVATFTGICSMAITAGLTFARFSQPRARLLFARNPVIGVHNGAPTLMLRFANERHNAITEASARLWLARNETTIEGSFFRRYYPLKLTREENPIFALSWTLMHVIDESSPLLGWEQENFDASDANLIVIFSGHDESSKQSVRGRRIYASKDVLVGCEYEDISRIDEHGAVTFDYHKFHDVRPAYRKSPDSAPV